jgi:hypothetical protein
MKMATKKNGNGNGNGRLPAVLADAFAEDTGIGFEEVTSNDIQIPFVRILQAMSPQIKKSDPAFISGATQGDIFDTVTNEVWSGDKGIVVLPVYFQTKYLEFVPRTQGGGFVGELASNSNEVQQAVRDQDSGMELLENGNELVRSAQHYVKICHKDGTLENAIVDMKKTQLKKSRLWLSMMMMQKHKGTTLPIFATTYRLKTIEDGNDKGSWYTWTIAVEGRVPSIEAYNDAKHLHGSIKSGELRIAPPPPETAVTDEDIPF